eukprot:scaffold621_cov39-Prasinocladus_malaysianus.AAC.1
MSAMKPLLNCMRMHISFKDGWFIKNTENGRCFKPTTSECAIPRLLRVKIKQQQTSKRFSERHAIQNVDIFLCCRRSFDRLDSLFVELNRPECAMMKVDLTA